MLLKKGTLPGRREEYPVRAGASVRKCVCVCVCVHIYVCMCRHSNLYKSIPLAPKVYGAANGKRKNPRAKDENRLKKKGPAKGAPWCPLFPRNPISPPPPPSSLERIIYNPTNFAYKSFRSSPSSFYIHIYFFFRFFRSAALR